MQSRLVHIPRHLLHVALSDLSSFGVPPAARDALRALLADLPLVPEASHSAQLVGQPEVTLPCLAVLARHVGQGLRDHNLSLANDREKLRVERHKLAFLSGDALADTVAAGDDRPARQTVLFIPDVMGSLAILLAERDAVGLASFVTTTTPLAELAHWRHVDLTAT